MKLDLKDYSAPLVTEISRLLGVAPMLTMCAAVLMLVITTFAVRDFVANQQQEERSMRLPQFKIQSAPVPKSLYQEYAATLARLSPVVQVSSSGDSLQVSIADASHYAEFMFVLNSIQGVSDRVIWRAQEICLAGCEGTAAKAVIKGLTESVDVTLRGENDD